MHRPFTRFRVSLVLVLVGSLLSASVAAADIPRERDPEPVLTAASIPFVVASPDEIRRLYLAYFRREPDSGGFQFWNGAHSTLKEISRHFARSPEFMETYGALDDGAFVEVVYQNALGRPSDGQGRRFWQEQLAGGMDRGVMMIGFSESEEFREKTS